MCFPAKRGDGRSLRRGLFHRRMCGESTLYRRGSRGRRITDGDPARSSADHGGIDRHRRGRRTGQRRLHCRCHTTYACLPASSGMDARAPVKRLLLHPDLPPSPTAKTFRRTPLRRLIIAPKAIRPGPSQMTRGVSGWRPRTRRFVPSVQSNTRISILWYTVRRTVDDYPCMHLLDFG
jgi:hypothetical protein